MTRFDAAANIVAGLLVWLALTGIVLFYVLFSRDALAPLWVKVTVVAAVSALTFAMFAKRYWKNLEH